MINLRRDEGVNYYCGSGINFNLFNQTYDESFLNGYYFTIGSRIKPLKETRNVYLIFELSPYANRNFNGGSLRTNLGISYWFEKLEK